MTDRIARLRANLEQPLLVTDPTNVRYLCGFSSSNCALFVEQDRARLFTDFRYIEAARAVDGVEPVMTKRNLIAELADYTPPQLLTYPLETVVAEKFEAAIDLAEATAA